MNIGRVIQDLANERPEAVAIVPAGSAPISYGALAVQLAGVGEILRSAGCGPESRVGVLLEHGLEPAIVLAGVGAGSVCAPLDPNYTDRELAAAADAYALGAVVVAVADEARGRRLAEAADLSLFLAERSGNMVSIRHARAPARPRAPQPAGPEAAFLARSSGTTGRPKLIPLTHANILALPINQRRLFAMTAADRAVCTLPLHYTAGLTQMLLTPLAMGASLAIPPADQREDVVAWWRELAPTWLSSSPAVLRRMLDLLPEERVDLPGLRLIICGASLVPEALAAEAEARLGAPVLNTYGASEGGILTANELDPARRKKGTVGLAWPDEVAVFTPNGERAPAGEPGEVGIRGPQVTPGYLDLPPPEDGWMRVGDVGVIDADGYLSIVGRIKEMINRGGVKVSPYEVEAAAVEHPAVAEAAAFAVPHPRLGEAVGLALVCRPGSSVSAAEMKAFLAERLAGFKTPQSVVFRDTLPRGPTGKVLRDRLAAEFDPAVGRTLTPAFDMLETQILGVWRRLLAREDLGVDDDFFEAGGDSLLGQEMLLEVEEIAGRKLPEAAIPYPITVRGLRDAVTATMEGSGPIAGRVTAASAGRGEPVFYCHGDYLTRGLYALKLGDLLQLDRPVHLVHPGFDPDVERSIEDLAAEIVPELLALQPEGAFTVGGYCNGALLAWELARQLRETGREVSKLVIVEPVSLNARPMFRALSRFWGLAGSEVRGLQMVRHWRFAEWKPGPLVIARLVLSKLAPRIFPLPPSPPSDRSPREERLRDLVFNTMAKYTPPPLDVPVHCLNAVEGSERPQFEPGYWRPLTASFEVTRIAGDHLGCVTVHLKDLAGKLRPILAA